MPEVQNIEKVRIILFEKINENIIYRQTFIAIHKYFDRIGHYLKHKKSRFLMESPSEDYFFLGKKQRCLTVCKYGENDFRPIKFLKGQNYTTKVEVPVTESVEETEERPDGSKVVRMVVKPKLDKQGKPLTETKKVTYSEPMAVQQSDKEVMRFSRAYTKEIDKYMAGNESFWKKHLPLIINVSIIVLFMLFIVMYTKVAQKEKIELIKIWDENAEQLLNEIKEPSFVGRIVDNFQREEAQNKAPIS